MKPFVFALSLLWVQLALAQATPPAEPASPPPAPLEPASAPDGTKTTDAPAAQGSAEATTAPASPTAAAAPTGPPRVRFETSAGNFVVQLDRERAPLTVEAFLGYVRTGFYDGTVFHRVINNFVAQGGGYDTSYAIKLPKGHLFNESGNGLTNRRGTIGMARSEGPHSATSQFYLNLADNPDLNPLPTRWGFAVFGEVVEGMEVVDRLGHAATGRVGTLEKDAPLKPIVIEKARVLE